eukprot:s429_g4.t1
MLALQLYRVPSRIVNRASESQLSSNKPSSLRARGVCWCANLAQGRRLSPGCQRSTAHQLIWPEATGGRRCPARSANGCRCIHRCAGAARQKAPRPEMGTESDAGRSPPCHVAALARSMNSASIGIGSASGTGHSRASPPEVARGAVRLNVAHDFQSASLLPVIGETAACVDHRSAFSRRAAE